MNKSGLIDIVSRELSTSKAEAARMIDAVTKAIASGVNDEEKVTISGFGTFKKRHRRARVTTNPTTREPVKIKASRSVGFTPSQLLKDSMKERG